MHLVTFAIGAITTYRTLEELYATKMRNAIRERRAEQRLLDGFKMIPAATLVEWQSRIDAWYNDPSSPPTEPDPFVPPQASESNVFALIISEPTVGYVFSSDIESSPP